MADLLMRLDTGETVRLADCDWVFYKACGCPRGVTMAVICDTVLHDEDAAWRDFFGQDRKRETNSLINRERKRGVTARLMTHAQYHAEVHPAMTALCPHGQQALPVEGVAADA